MTARPSRVLTNGALTTVLLLAACAKSNSPASLDVCKAVIEHPKGSRAHIQYHFQLTNRGSKTITAVRINFEDPASLQANAIKFIPTRPVGVDDYDRAIAPHETVMWMPHTDGLPRTASPLKSGALPCSVLSVRYADGHTWAIAPGILAPGEVWNPER